MTGEKRRMWMGVRNTLKYVVTMLCCIAFMASASVTVFADGIGDTGDTGQGNIGGSNVYTFYYYYNSASDAIELTVVTKNPIASFGNTNSHTYSSPYDGVVLNTSNPRLGRSLDDAISDMIRIGGYQMSVADAKSELNSLGYYDKGNGIWKYNGGYLTYISAVKIRKQTHTVSYDANGGSGAPSSQTKTEGVNLTLRSGRPHRTGYTFKYWNASIGGRYYPGGLYTHDQDGGTVVMKAYWRDETAPGGTIVAVPNDWSAGNGTVTITAQDQGSGLSSFILERYSYVTGTWITVRTWSLGGTTSQVSRSYTETAEGVFSYRVTISDKAGNVSQASSNKIYLDHSNPVIYGLDRVQTDWTNVAPVIGITTTDYLSGTNYDGSGVVSVVIQNDSGITVAGGGSTASYTLQPRDEGIHTWYVTIQDAVGHVSRGQVTTKYDITKPGMDGTEVTHVVNGVTYSGYCQDNIIKQHIDDEVRRSPNNPNVSSGVRSVILYRVTGNNREVIYGDLTKKVFDSSYTHSYFDMFYEIQREEKTASYYEVIVTDFAGNKSVKKLTSQYSLLSWFHTSIDRSTYE